jgi:hypothetical protein
VKFLLLQVKNRSQESHNQPMIVSNVLSNVRTQKKAASAVQNSRLGGNPNTKNMANAAAFLCLDGVTSPIYRMSSYNRCLLGVLSTVP